MNLNKLFPRLTIRVKLAIAFLLLAIIPLGVMAGIGTRMSIGHVRALGMATLGHELEVARGQTQRLLQGVERDVAYLAGAVLAPLLGEPLRADWDVRGRVVTPVLAANTALFRVKAIDPAGELRFVAGSPDAVESHTEDHTGGLYYALRASALEANERLMIPVELSRGDQGATGEVTTLPAVAFLWPVRDSEGTFRGVVVGEAHASVLFAGLDGDSSDVDGITGLVGSDGLFVYHSERKRDWASLLATRSVVSLATDFSQDVASRILSGSAGTIATADQRIVSFVPLSLSGSGIPPLILYRVVPLSALEAPVRSFLAWVGAGGLLVLLVVLGLALLAAHQFTQPIYQLRQGARRLARGLSETPLHISTNDELEDLAADFSTMAKSLSEHRQQLEELVTERTRELWQMHAELKGILEHSADAIVGLDPDRRVRVWNKGAEALFGYTAAEARDRDVDRLLLPDTLKAKAEAAFIRRELEERGVLVNLQTRRSPKVGEPFPVSITQTVIQDEEDRRLGYSLIVRDTRMQAKLEEQMRRSERLATVSVMAAGLAHELNNPLGVITNRIECMESEVDETCPDCFLENDLAVLRQHTDRLAQVTQDLLRFAHEEDGEMKPLAVASIVSRMASLLERTYASRNIRLETSICEDIPLFTGSEKAIETVCVNLLLNAADATPAGGTVVLEARPCPSGRCVEFNVSDTGGGVPAQLRDRIFEPFFTTKASGRGTGLGLAVCRSIVERHGGEIWVESAVGTGSRFVVRLPLEPQGMTWMAQRY